MNMEMIIENKLDSKDIVLIGLLNSISIEKGSDTFEYSYKDIVSDLPIIFNSSSFKANSTKIRRMLDKEGMRNFIGREVDKRGRGVGSVVVFTVNRCNIDKLDLKNIIS